MILRETNVFFTPIFICNLGVIHETNFSFYSVYSLDDKKFSITGGSFKNYVTHKMTFSDSPSPYVALYYFPPTLLPPAWYTKKCQHGMKQKRICLCIWLLTVSRSHYIKGERKKVRNFSFNLCAHSFLHIDIHILTSQFEKWWNYNSLDLVI